MLVFDRDRLGWRLAIRTMVGLLVPLALSRVLAMPNLTWVGIGAYLLAIGDSTDDCDRLQPLRLIVGAVFGGVAVATGVLAGGALVPAMLGMLFWGILSGLMGVYGNAFATMGLPIAWAYVELGLPAHDRTIGQAAMLGALFALGGIVILVLTWLVRIAGPYGPLKHQTAACFRALATYLDAVGQPHRQDQTAMVSPETRVRAPIAEARRVIAELHRRQHGWSRVAERQAVLIQIADRLFSLAAALKENPLPADGPAVAAQGDDAGRALVAATAARLANALAGHGDTMRLRDDLAALDRAAAGAAGPASAADIHRRIAAAMAQAVRVALGNAVPQAIPAARPAPAAWDLSAALAPLATCFDRRSVVARHAARFGVVAAIAIVVFWVFPPPFGYWVPLTVTVVLKPYAGATLARTVQRIIGTGAGILVGSAIMPLLTTPAMLLAAVGFAFFWLMVVLPFNYSLAIFFLSAGLIPFEHFLTPALGPDIGLLRLVATGIGAVLAILGGHLLWPTFERDALPALLCASLRSMAGYADRVLAGDALPADAAQREAAHRQAGLDTTNLQAAIQRAASESGGDPETRHALMLASSALQGLFNSLNAVVTIGAAPIVATPQRAAFRGVLASALSRFAAACDPAKPAAWREDRMIAADADSPQDPEIARMVAQLALLDAGFQRLRPG